MKFTRSCLCGGVLVLCLGIIGLLAGCAFTDVSLRVAHLARPKQILVYDFAVSPDEVNPKAAAEIGLGNLVSTIPRTSQEVSIGHDAAEALSKHLLAEVQALGIPAVRATTNSIVNSDTLLVKGQFVSIKNSARTNQVVVGLGVGRTEVQTLTQVYGVIQGQKQLVDKFGVNARRRSTPTGIHPATDRLAISAVFSVGLAVGSEAFAENLDANAAQAAKVIASQLKHFYRAQGWLNK